MKERRYSEDDGGNLTQETGDVPVRTALLC